METTAKFTNDPTAVAEADDILVADNILSISETDAETPSQNLSTRVSNALQTTLDIHILIGLFSTQIKPALPHFGLRYVNNAGQFTIELGVESTHVCSYQLFIDKTNLGSISISRNWEFSKEETKIFEFTLRNLLYPLRNALLYRDAIQRALRDPLTGIYNRATFEETLSRETKLARRGASALSLIVLDIDKFKSVNDNYGHVVGDCVIKSIAEKTINCIRSTDIVFRYGGEEFVIILSNTDINGAKHLAERIRKSIEATTTKCGTTEANVTVSLGVAQLSENETSTEFFTRTDRALYQAKDSGRNRVEVG